MREGAASPLRNVWAQVAGFVGVVVLDQASKLQAVANLSSDLSAGLPSGGAADTSFGGFLRIGVEYNSGVLFRFLVPFLSPTLVYGLLFALVALLLVRHGLVRPVATVRWGIVLALGGATGNLVDRITLGQVVDFLSVGVPGIAWRSPAFNLADVAICAGAALLAWGEFTHSQPTPSLHGVPRPGTHGVRNS